MHPPAGAGRNTAPLKGAPAYQAADRKHSYLMGHLFLHGIFPRR